MIVAVKEQLNTTIKKATTAEMLVNRVKKWDKPKNVDLSHRVTSAGFEPATFGAEIRNSIQLNYEAFLREKNIEYSEKTKSILYILFSIFLN
jgi:hypothetical protein